MMEVSSDEEAQAVLLEGMEGTQYITIQRTDGEGLGKGVPLLTLNGELISEGMVVDMINAGVGNEYNAGTQYYETDDLLPHELTEEDKKLAAALVAVHQLQTQNKQQQLHTQVQTNEPPLPDVSQLATLAPVNTYAIHSIAQPEPSPVYSGIQSYKRSSHNVKQEFINVKSEYDIDVSAESSEDTTPASGQKRSLPHKKRIARKLKQQTKKSNVSKKDIGKNNEETDNMIVHQEQPQSFKCELCGSQFDGQLKFFQHLKAHYEPVKQETRVAQATNTNITIASTESIQNMPNPVLEEFSEPEDLMEGIRGVVEETGAQIDEESDSSPLVNNSSNLWGISDVTEPNVAQPSEQDKVEKELQENYVEASTSGISKKKKTASKKVKKSQNDEMSCPECDRTFHHKNSLVYHMRSHTGERPHQCEICGKSFFAASALKVHKRLHSGDKPYKCEDCGRNFRQWGDLKYHSMSIHSEQKQFQCEYCGKDFARKYSLIVHRRIHTGEKNYRCEYCNKSFRASSYLQNHRRIHTGEKPHACTVCGKPFRVRSDMKRHMHTHTRGRQERPANRTAVGKNLSDDDEDKGSQSNVVKSIDENDKVLHNSTIQDLVQELKLEVEQNNVVEIVPPDDNPESILPHGGGQGSQVDRLYPVSSGNDGNTDRDPLEPVDRVPDSL
uniref:C2H2-type domain-containing protein n=1 Tax=Bracon brevicornis TaxID=1563983 RepID=A0A6V7LAY4_9HYME